MASKKTKKPVMGRPRVGLSDATYLMRLPDALMREARARASDEGVSFAEWVRAAVQLKCDSK